MKKIIRLSKFKNKGFTLIELLVVIAIIGILAGLVMISTSRARKQARDTQRKEMVRAISGAMELYANDNDGRYPTNLPNDLNNYISAGSGWNTKAPKCLTSQNSQVNWDQCFSSLSESGYTISTRLESGGTFSCSTGGACQ
jgi:prepilin-type N-terminal cleavage/methylation domain-containing protein